MPRTQDRRRAQSQTHAEGRQSARDPPAPELGAALSGLGTRGHARKMGPGPVAPGVLRF